MGRSLHALAALLLSTALCSGETLRRVSMSDVVDRLRAEGVPVCFEQSENKKEDAITEKQDKELIETIPADQRTEDERETLDSYQTQLSAGESLNGSVWRQKRFDLDFPAPVNAAAVLDAAVKADPAYQWKMIAGKYVVFPKEHSFNQPLAAFAVARLSYREFMQQMTDDVARPANLMVVSTGGSALNDYQDALYSLTLKDTDTLTALTLIANTLGPRVYWSTDSQYSKSYLSISSVAKK